jgi:hypothetical protein
MANADVVVIQAIAPANLAWKRGDISVVLSVIKSVLILFLPAQRLLSNYGRNPRTSALTGASLATSISFVDLFEVEISQIHVSVLQYVYGENIFPLCSDGL